MTTTPRRPGQPSHRETLTLTGAQWSLILDFDQAQTESLLGQFAVRRIEFSDLDELLGLAREALHYDDTTPESETLGMPELDAIALWDSGNSIAEEVTIVVYLSDQDHVKLPLASDRMRLADFRHKGRVGPDAARHALTGLLHLHNRTIARFRTAQIPATSPLSTSPLAASAPTHAGALGTRGGTIAHHAAVTAARASFPVPLEITDDRWAAIAETREGDYDRWHGHFIAGEDVVDVLAAAREALAGLHATDPRALPLLRDIDVVETGAAPDTTMQVIVRVEVGDRTLRLTTGFLDIATFRTHLTGQAAPRALLGLLLGHRNRLVRQLAEAMEAR